MKVEILFPEVCNLYGDLQNVYYLKRSCPELEIAETDLHSKPRFLDEDVALVYMGSTTEQGLALAAEALRPCGCWSSVRAMLSIGCPLAKATNFVRVLPMSIVRCREWLFACGISVQR